MRPLALSGKNRAERSLGRGPSEAVSGCGGQTSLGPAAAPAHQPADQGSGGCRVRVYEEQPGGVLYRAVYDPASREEIRKSLRHRDRQAAMRYADDMVARLRRGVDDMNAIKPTVRRVTRLYRSYRTPDKKPAQQQEDDRQIEMWIRVLGPDYDLRRISQREWDAFIRLRRAGSINPRGRQVANKKERKPVGDRTIERDLGFLRGVCRWACDFRDDAGYLLLERDPTRGLAIPRERNVNRPVASHERVQKIREHYRKPRMRVERAARRQCAESYLPELFEIVVGSGRRISAVCSLRVEDLDLDGNPKAPWGSITWSDDFDKMGKTWRCPVSAQVREALESALCKRASLGTIGAGWLFSGAWQPERPSVTRRSASG